MAENTARYKSSTIHPNTPVVPPADTLRIIPQAWDKGRSSTNCRIPIGICSVEKNVLHRKDIGMMMYDVKRGASV